MKRRMICLALAFSMLFGINAVSDDAQTGYTASVPSEYLSACDHAGRVEALTYESGDYVRGGTAIEKTAYVYLPYGYDENDAETKDELYQILLECR